MPIPYLCSVDIHTGKPASKFGVGVIPTDTRLLTVHTIRSRNIYEAWTSVAGLMDMPGANAFAYKPLIIVGKRWHG